VFSTRADAELDAGLLEHIANGQRQAQKPTIDVAVTTSEVEPATRSAEGL